MVQIIQEEPKVQRYEYPVGTLIKALKKNLEEHKKDFIVAKDEYHRQVDKDLRAAIKRNKNKEKYSVPFRREPINREEDYLDWISFYEEMTFGPVPKEMGTVKLTKDEFDQIVNDKWQWAVEAKTTNFVYSSASNAR